MLKLLTVVLGLVLSAAAWQAPATQAAPNKAARYMSMLSGQEVVPGPGDPDGDGHISLSVNPHASFCWFMETSGVSPNLTAVHLHRGPAGQRGELVMELHDAISDPDVGGCHRDLDKGLLRDLSKNLGSYYIDVHNDEFPEGALRSQLDNGSPVWFSFGIDGAQVVPGPGDGDASSLGQLGFSGTRTCYMQNPGNISAPLTAVHLHHGVPGEVGEEVALLHGPSTDIDVGACVGLDAVLVEDIQRNPQEYYVDVHNEEYPGGALRGQVG